jgi:hypothetical protein
LADARRGNDIPWSALLAACSGIADWLAAARQGFVVALL